MNYIDIEAMGLVTILKKNIRNIIDVQMNPSATYVSTGMSPKQFASVKYNVGKFSNEQLIDLYEFLLDIDLSLKSGELQFSNNTKENNQLFNVYIINNFLSRVL